MSRVRDTSVLLRVVAGERRALPEWRAITRPALATHDAELALAARALGFRVLGASPR